MGVTDKKRSLWSSIKIAEYGPAMLVPESTERVCSYLLDLYLTGYRVSS